MGPPHTARDLCKCSKTESCFEVGVLLSSSNVGHRDRYRKSKTRIQMLSNLARQIEVHRRQGKPGPLARKHSKENNGSGKTVEDDSADRRTTEKERRRHQASFVRVFKIHRGRQAIHLPRFIVWSRGFDSSPTSPVEKVSVVPTDAARSPPCLALHPLRPCRPLLAFSLAELLAWGSLLWTRWRILQASTDCRARGAWQLSCLVLSGTPRPL